MTSRTYDLRRLAMRAKNAQIRCNDIAAELSELGVAGASSAEDAAWSMGSIFKRLMDEADKTRDPRGAVRITAEST